MSEEIIEKKELRVKPNLEDYEGVCRNFKWEDVHEEISWFKDGKLNAAYNAVDRHAESWRDNKVALYWEGRSTGVPC